MVLKTRDGKSHRTLFFKKNRIKLLHQLTQKIQLEKIRNFFDYFGVFIIFVSFFCLFTSYALAEV